MRLSADDVERQFIEGVVAKAWSFTEKDEDLAARALEDGLWCLANLGSSVAVRSRSLKLLVRHHTWLLANSRALAADGPERVLLARSDMLRLARLGARCKVIGISKERGSPRVHKVWTGHVRAPRLLARIAWPGDSAAAEVGDGPRDFNLDAARQLASTLCQHLEMLCPAAPSARENKASLS